jgi:hypothetical protein
MAGLNRFVVEEHRRRSERPEVRPMRCHEQQRGYHEAHGLLLSF